MFKDLYEFIDSSEKVPNSTFLDTFFENIHKFAFFENLNSVCLKNDNMIIKELISSGNYINILENLLLKSGLNYGQLPKGLLLFHWYPNKGRGRTPSVIISIGR